MAKLKVIYAPQYLGYNFGDGHPFWPERAAHFLEKLKGTNIDYELITPQPASDEMIIRAHTPGYLERVLDLAKKSGALSPDTPLNPSVLEAAYLSVGGSIEALRLALNGERVVNLLGGLHHAEQDDSSGFCVFNDHAIAIRQLQHEKLIERAVIYDIDVHAGNGTQDIFYKDPSVFNISIHQSPAMFYPGTGFAGQIGAGAGKGFTLNISLPSGSGPEKYLEALDEALERGRDFPADLGVVIFGADTYKLDPLAGLQLELDTYREIAQRFRSFPQLAVLCAGGYSKAVPDVWLAFLASWLEDGS